jgi:hypothetical protein
MIDVSLYPHQHAVVADLESKTIVLEGGLGCGKTWTIVAWATRQAIHNAPCAGLLVEPTYALIRDILVPTFREAYEQWGLPYSYHKTDHVLTVGAPLSGVPIFLRSGDAPERIIGFKVGWFGIDEADTLDEEVYKRCVGRFRDPRAKLRQALIGGTPEEGFRWTHRRFHLHPREDTRLIVGVPTTANKALDAEYLADLIASASDDDEVARITMGKRSAKGGLVYHTFDRAKHVRPCPNPHEGEIEVWADFNVGKMVWLLARVVGDEAHVWGEVVGYDTDTASQIVKTAHALADMIEGQTGHRPSLEEACRRATVRCDASGASRRTVGKSDAGFRVRHLPTNPLVRDRIAAVNKRLRMDPPRLHVAPGCAETIMTLEQHGRDKTGEPAKAKDTKEGLDHAGDALGYGVYGHWPFQMPRGNSRQMH